MAGGARDCDRELTERFRGGDELALREVYRRFGGPMHALAFGMLRDRADAADAVQQAFLQAWRSAERFDVERNLGPWMFQIVRRVCLDALRRRRRRPVTTAAVDLADAGSVDESIERTWMRWEVRRAIDNLPPARARPTGRGPAWPPGGPGPGRTATSPCRAARRGARRSRGG